MMFLAGWGILLLGILIGYVLRGIFIMNDSAMKAFEDQKRYQDWRGK